MDALVCVLVFSSRTARASVAVSRAAPRCSRGSSLAITAPVLTVSSTCPDGGAPQPVGEGLVGRVEPPPPPPGTRTSVLDRSIKPSISSPAACGRTSSQQEVTSRRPDFSELLAQWVLCCGGWGGGGGPGGPSSPDDPGSEQKGLTRPLLSPLPVSRLL